MGFGQHNSFIPWHTATPDFVQQNSAVEEADTVQCGSSGRRDDPSQSTSQEEEEEGEETFEDDFEDEEDNSAAEQAVDCAENLLQGDKTPVDTAGAGRSLTVPNSIRSIQGSIGGWTPEA